MMNPLKSAKIAVLKRIALEDYGYVQYYTKMINNWMYKCEDIASKNPNFITDRRYQEMSGSITYWSKKIDFWTHEFQEKKEELQKLGVRVDLVL